MPVIAALAQFCEHYAATILPITKDYSRASQSFLFAHLTREDMKGEKMLDKMSARCAALSVASGDKKYIDGACVLTDSDGDQIFSTFDTRDTDKSQPEMNCGTHIITGGTGKYKGITGSEPFACITMPALAGPGGYTAMDVPHNTTWEIK